MFGCLSQGSTESCAWSLWRTSMSVRSRLPANTGRWEVNTWVRALRFSTSKPHFVHIYFCLYSVGETQCHSVHYLNRLNWPTVTSPGDGFNVFFLVFFLVCVSQSEKLLLFDTVQSELEEKIRRLEEDRHSIDITSGTDRGCNQQLSEMSFLIIYQIKTIRGWASSDILTSGQHLQND